MRQFFKKLAKVTVISLMLITFSGQAKTIVVHCRNENAVKEIGAQLRMAGLEPIEFGRERDVSLWVKAPGAPAGAGLFVDDELFMKDKFEQGKFFKRDELTRAAAIRLLGERIGYAIEPGDQVVLDRSKIIE